MRNRIFLLTGVLVAGCSDGHTFVPSDPCSACKDNEVCNVDQCVSKNECEEVGGVTAADGSCQICGDKVVSGGEQCDDGEESALCNANCTFSTCGDSVVNVASGEVCDDGSNDGRYGGCNSDCTLAPYCGGETAKDACNDNDVCTKDLCEGTTCVHSWDAETCNHVSFVVPPMQTVFVGATWPDFSVQVEDSAGRVVKVSYQVTLVSSGALNRTVQKDLEDGAASFSGFMASKVGPATLEVTVPNVGTAQKTIAVIDPSPSCLDDSDCSTGMICNENWGICVLPSCSAQPDFTPCEVITEPDYSYDICVGGTCISPGCGDASCNTPGPNFPLADTQMWKCFDDQYSITCPGESSDYYGQDAQRGWSSEHGPTERFTVDESSGNKIIKDEVTSLEWMGCVQGYENCSDASQICSGTNHLCTWKEALNYCNTLNWGGKTDWRVPDLYELSTLIDFEENYPAIDPTTFTDMENPRGYEFWTSASSPYGISEFVMAIQFFEGTTEGKDTTEIAATRCVRSNPHIAPLSRFERSGKTSPVVIDHFTNLMWQGCLGSAESPCNPSYVSKYRWGNAVEYCKNLSWDGYNGWRLPNVLEATSIIQYRSETRVDPIAFPMINSGTTLWTSTPSVEVRSIFDNPTKYITAWIVPINSYYTLSFYEKSEPREVMCVRDE